MLEVIATSRRSLGDGLLQQGASGDTNAVGSRNVNLLASARVAAGASGALDALSGEQAGELQASPDFMASTNTSWKALTAASA